MSSELVVGLDVGGTNLRIGLVDENYRLRDFTVESSRSALAGPKSAATLIQRLATYLERVGAVPKSVVVGFPATVDVTRRVVLSTANVEGFDDVPFADLVEEAIGVPTFLERDTNLLLMHDMWDKDLSGQQIVLGCYPGTGFGSALAIGGKLHVGKTGSEGELGHMPVKGLTLRCGCGNIGCVEAIASGKYLEQLVERHFPGTPIGEAFLRHAETDILLDFVDSLSLPVATAVNILDPHAVILGGGVIAMDAFPRQYLEERIRIHTRKPEPAASLALMFAEPRQENGVIGAGIYGFRQVLGRTA